jgi:hypothetical protein
MAKKYHIVTYNWMHTIKRNIKRYVTMMYLEVLSQNSPGKAEENHKISESGKAET